MSKLSRIEKDKKYLELFDLQDSFPLSVEGLLMFAEVVVNTLITGSPSINRIQADILDFLLTGSKYRMVEAQRGQAKTTLTAIYAVFRLIHEPYYRIVIFSQNSRRAKEIAGWVIKIMNGLDFLEFMRPDKYNGDKSSLTEGYDVHSALKGSDKSPSIAAYSIEAGAQGSRADLIIADDVESLQNSRTSLGRDILEGATKEFESINSHGDIIYLGTPQSVNSIYNNLPSRGYQLRIWTGRYPNSEEIKSYGEYLAPIIVEDIIEDPSLQSGYGLDGLSGAPTCPEMFDDDALIIKEISQGKAKFQLQFMLNTKLSDADRYPLRLSDLIVTNFSSEEAPIMPIWNNSPYNCIQNAPRFGNRETDKFYHPVNKEYQYSKFDRKVAFIDPAGGAKNGDESGVAIVGVIGTYLYLIDSFGVAGGYSKETLTYIVNRIKKSGCREVFLEKNFGNGAYTSVIKPYFERLWNVVVTDDDCYVTTQKEVRIIDTIEPFMNTHRLVINECILIDDMKSTEKYPTDIRLGFSLFSQFSMITLEKNSLRHDDRLDAVYGAISRISAQIDYDEYAKRTRDEINKANQWMKDMNDPNKRRGLLYNGYGVKSTLGLNSLNLRFGIK